MNFFFDIIIGNNIVDDFERVRLMLTPFQINHINIKRKTQKFKLVTQIEHLQELHEQYLQQQNQVDVSLSSNDVSLIAKELEQT